MKKFILLIIGVAALSLFSWLTSQHASLPQQSQASEIDEGKLLNEWRGCLGDYMSRLPEEFKFAKAIRDPKIDGMISLWPVFQNAQSNMEIFFANVCKAPQAAWLSECFHRTNHDNDCSMRLNQTIDAEWQTHGKQKLDLLRYDQEKIMLSYQRCLVEKLAAQTPKPNTYSIDDGFFDKINISCGYDAVEWRDKICTPRYGAYQCRSLVMQNPLLMLQAMSYDYGSNRWGFPDEAFTSSQVEAFIEAHHQALQGQAQAQTKLARIYLRGDGIERNMAEAIKWFQKASAQGDANAEAQLGSLYLSGIHAVGVPPDSELQGAALVRKAAEQGNASAKKTMSIFQISE